MPLFSYVLFYVQTSHPRRYLLNWTVGENSLQTKPMLTFMWYIWNMIGIWSLKWQCVLSSPSSVLPTEVAQAIGGNSSGFSQHDTADRKPRPQAALRRCWPPRGLLQGTVHSSWPVWPCSLPPIYVRVSPLSLVTCLSEISHFIEIPSIQFIHVTSYQNF